MINVGGSKIASLLPNRIIRTNNRKTSCTLHLTFDDGPHPVYTLKVCELLESHNIKATFFCIGENIEKYPEITKVLIDKGHLVANHSDTHRNFSAQPLSIQLNEIRRCQSGIERFDPLARKIFRAPGGKLGVLLMTRLKLAKWDIVHWSYDSMDYKRLPLEEQLKVFQDRPVRDGDILLFHDDEQLAIDILEEMLPKWIKMGFRFATT